MATTSRPFGTGFSTPEKYLYVVDRYTNMDFNLSSFNYLQVLTVAADGTLSEPKEPLPLPVGNRVMPQGIAVY